MLSNSLSISSSDPTYEAWKQTDLSNLPILKNSFRSYLRGMETTSLFISLFPDFKPFRSYLRGMETWSQYSSFHQNTPQFRSYLRGMETNHFHPPFHPMGLVPILPTRHGNYNLHIASLLVCQVPILPTRHGNPLQFSEILQPACRSDPTYEAWKLNWMESLLHEASLCSDPTYEAWKPLWSLQ